MDEVIRFLDHLDSPFIELLALAGAILAGMATKYLLFRTLSLYRSPDAPILIASLRSHMNRPLMLLLPLLFIVFILPVLPITNRQLLLYRRVVEVALVMAFAWALIRLLSVFLDVIRHKYQVKANNIRERRLLTQLSFLRKLMMVVIVVIASSIILMSFETARRLGTGLLTSAGIAGIIVGFAAQRSLANLLAGFQIAFTQPIRIDDVVVVENEWGRVEEITLTYVVLRLWDMRRLILPINYFLEKPFQNWTRISSALLGTVLMYADYTIPVDALRTELRRILESSVLWDKQVGDLLVTDAKEHTIELRATVSAENSSKLYDLRCLVREKLIEYIRTQYPNSLPRTRVELPETTAGKKGSDDASDILSGFSPPGT